MPDDVSIKIDERRFTFWHQVSIQLALDNFSTVQFQAPFEPERPEFRSTFKPFSYKPLTLHVDDELMFTGTLVGVEPRGDAASRTVLASGYSIPAQLADVTVPASAFPLQFNRLTFKQIVDKLAAPFALRVEIEGDDQRKFRKIAIEPDEKVYSFLSKLARQRGLVITDGPDGSLRFVRSTDTASPVAVLAEGSPPLLSAAATFSPQSYYSELTGIARTRSGRKGRKHTEQNERLRHLRPLTFQLTDTDSPDLATAVQMKMARMFGNMVAYVVRVPTWRDARNTLWKPNTLIRLTAPSAMIYSPTDLLIRDVLMAHSDRQHIATLGVVLPGAFSGKQPEAFPWD